MAIAEGDKLPMGATFKRIVDGKPSDVPAADIFAGKKVRQTFRRTTHSYTVCALHVDTKSVHPGTERRCARMSVARGLLGLRLRLCAVQLNCM
jgi:hypothetical protein